MLQDAGLSPPGLFSGKKINVLILGRNTCERKVFSSKSLDENFADSKQHLSLIHI